MELTSDQFIAKYNDMPLHIQNAISSNKLTANIYNIALRHKLNEAQCNTLLEQTNLLIMDIVPRTDFSILLEQKLGIPGDKALLLFSDIKGDILARLNEYENFTDMTDENLAEAFKTFKDSEGGVQKKQLEMIDDKLGSVVKLSSEQTVIQDKREVSAPIMPAEPAQIPGQQPQSLPQPAAEPQAPIQTPAAPATEPIKASVPPGHDPYREPPTA